MSEVPVQVAVVGDAVPDIIAHVSRIPAAEESVYGPPPVMRFGGAAANVAVAAARLGARVGFVGRVGADENGRAVRADLEENGVACGGLVEDETHGTGAVIALQEDSGGRAMLGLVMDAAYHELIPADLRWEGLLSAPTVCVGGFLMVAQPARDTALLAIDEAIERGATVYYDPNVRGGRVVVPQERANAHWEAMRRSNVVVATDEEMAAIGRLCLGQDPDMSPPLASRLVASTLLERDEGCALVVIKRGARGATAVSSDGQSEHMPAFAVEVVDTIGAGDCFLAALMVARLSGTSLAETLRFANAAAALSTTRAGGRAAPSLPAVERFLAAYREDSS